MGNNLTTIKLTIKLSTSDSAFRILKKSIKLAKLKILQAGSHLSIPNYQLSRHFSMTNFVVILLLWSV